MRLIDTMATVPLNSNHPTPKATPQLGPCSPEIQHALRLVLSIVFTQDEVSLLLGQSHGSATFRPSALYDEVIERISESGVTWEQCASWVEQKLSADLCSFLGLSPIEIAEFPRKHELDAGELAALLWLLLVQRTRVLEPLFNNLCREVELILIQKSASTSYFSRRVRRSTQ